MLAGSLYYHFDSKESMLDEILSTFLDELWQGYDAVLAAGLGPRETIEALVTESFREIDRHRAAVAIYQKESRHLAAQPRFHYLTDSQQKFEKAWLGTLERGVADAGLPRRPGHPAHLPVRARHRVGRGVLVPAGRAAQPRGDRPPVPVDGAGRNRRTQLNRPEESSWPRPTSSKRSARRWAGARADWPGSTRPTSARTSCSALVERSGRRPGRRRGRRLRLPGHGGPAGRGHRPHGWLAAGLPEEVPGVTVDRQCGSSQQAVHFAAQARALRHPGPGRRGRRAEHDADPHRLRLPAGRRAARADRGPVRGQRGLAGPLRRPAGQPVPRRRADRREVGHLARATWRSSRSAPTSGRSAPSTRAASSGSSWRTGR